MVGPEAGPGALSLDLEAAGQKYDSDDQKRRQRQHLDQRRPELELAEGLHRDQIHRHHRHQRDERERPLRDRLERGPIVEVARDRGAVHDGRHRPVQEVHPARNESRFLPEELTSVRDERARCRAVQHQFAERAQDQEHEAAADPVDQEQPGPRGREPCSRAHEQPRPDGAADRDHLHLPVVQVVVITRVLTGECAAVLSAAGSGVLGSGGIEFLSS